MVDAVKIGDARLAATSEGAGDPVLLIHGALVADSYGPMLSEGDLTRSYQVITYHRRGFQGSAPVASGHTIADEARDALAVLDHYGVGSAHVVGHSYGGVVALQLAIDAPSRVRSLGLFEPALLSVPSAEAFGSGVGPVVERFEARDNEGALMAFLELVGGPDPMSRLTKLPEAATEQALADLATLFAGDFPALSGWTVTEEQLRSIDVPALTVLGSESADLFRESIDVLEATLPQSRPFRLAGAAHFLQMEQPAAMSNAVRSFLDG
jgi:pimeloyl-ACP methyl ester carboxylesterase